MIAANMTEMFSSIQGEGKYVGCRQFFVRFSRCNLSCAYCDTSFADTPHCLFERHAGSHEFEKLANPISVDTAADIIGDALAKNFHQAVSFTGGEPLLNAEFIAALAPRIKAAAKKNSRRNDSGAKIFLETNGTLYEQLAKTYDAVDIISMDIKLPSAAGAEHWDAHEKFMRAAKGKELYVKTVITADTKNDEFLRALELLRNEAKDAPLFLQPVTPVGEIVAPSPQKIIGLQDTALRMGIDTRVIPQTHRAIGQL